MATASKTPPNVRYKANHINEGYDVFQDGTYIGKVEKWERRYNLRRVYVSRGWRARTADGRPLFDGHGATADTRHNATLALIAALNTDTEG